MFQNDMPAVCPGSMGESLLEALAGDLALMDHCQMGQIRFVQQALPYTVNLETYITSRVLAISSTCHAPSLALPRNSKDEQSF